MQLINPDSFSMFMPFRVSQQLPSVHNNSEGSSACRIHGTRLFIEATSVTFSAH